MIGRERERRKKEGRATMTRICFLKDAPSNPSSGTNMPLVSSLCCESLGGRGRKGEGG
jgi:hypothetical protein